VLLTLSAFLAIDPAPRLSGSPDVTYSCQTKHLIRSVIKDKWLFREIVNCRRFFIDNSKSIEYKQDLNSSRRET